jgi:hypothetical protein
MNCTGAVANRVLYPFVNVELTKGREDSEMGSVPDGGRAPEQRPSTG